MKNLLLLYVVVFNSLIALSQNTLVNDQGVISVAKIDTVDYYTLGSQDAKSYYKIDPGVIIGEVIFGATSIFILPAIPAIAIMLSPPKMMHTLNNPNDKLLTINPTYRKGYEIGMKKKKRKVAKITFFSSFIPGFYGFAIFALKGLHD